MELGAFFPQTVIEADPKAVGEFACAVEELGYDHLLTYEHVVGVDPDRPEGWDGYYDIDDAFHEPFVLFGYLAAVTETIRLGTGILVLPQRQTVLVAKQAAEIDVLSGGRVTLGVGTGWSEPEYQALGEDFDTRGKRIESQIEVLRELWTQETVEHDDKWHTLSKVGINPLPVQREIPIWMGGTAPPVIKRTAKVADGWISHGFDSFERTRKQIGLLRKHAQTLGRSPDDLSIVGHFVLRSKDPSKWRDRLEEWRDVGATHVIVSTMELDHFSAEEHMRTLEEFREVAGDVHT